MLIREMFQKPIDRDIKAVIKVGQSDDENIKQELEEYVVTRELAKNFSEFFANYKTSINGNTDKMGVWISGFFGSGKSHFLKILSYLLGNKEVGGKQAIDYFIDDNKITDAMVLADIKKCADMADQTDVILFNIDSKSEQANKQSKDAIISVFLKVFNDMQGFYGANAHLANLERNLSDDGRYDEFQKLFLEARGKEWKVERQKYDFLQDIIVDILVKMNYMSETAARNWCEKTVGNYDISIEDFAKQVAKYIESKGKNHHVIFLVDEIGQYIGSDSNLMLNLQTVTEDLGTECKGKAWVIVTSQQEIDELIEGMRQRANDFSKIQGRFDTRVSLTAANVDEVIKKRILEKDETASQTLRLIYEQKETILRNLIVFNDSVEKKLYSGADDFVISYPMVPYQFRLMGRVLTSIRKHSASGKQYSDHARSMLAVTKDAIASIKQRDAGAVVPLNLFYNALRRDLDDSHAGVIISAMDNEIINPDKEDYCFTVEVLKVLFMLKYITDVEPNVDNLVSLLVDDLDTNRVDLKTKVEESLKTLTSQKLVQKNRDLYEFLSDEEQEINREIDAQNVETGELTSKIAAMIFEGIFQTSDKRYKYPKQKGRYTFPYNQYVDDYRHRSNQSYDIGMRIITTNYETHDETTLRMMSGQGNEVLVVLPDDRIFIDELRESMKIEKFLRSPASADILAKYEQIKAIKGEEMRRRASDAKDYLQDAMKEADIYVVGDKAQISSKDVVTRINEALERLVSTVYHKLEYIDAFYGEGDIRKLLEKTSQQKMKLGDEEQPNTHALSDLRDYITAETGRHSKTSIKTVLERFMKAPYGYIEDDVEWLVAKLFKDGDISFTVNQAPVSLNNKSVDDIIDYITKKQYIEKLLIERKAAIDPPHIKTAREVMKELFGTSGTTEDADAVMRDFHKYCNDMLHTIREYEVAGEGKPYPGKRMLEDGKSLLRKVTQIQEPVDFFKTITEKQSDYLEYAEQHELIQSFFSGEQKKIFDDALDKMRIYDESKTFIVDENVEKYVEEIKNILSNPEPYDYIPKLPGLVRSFTESYMDVFDSMSKPIYEAIEDAKQRIISELDGKPYKEELSERFLALFRDLKEKADCCNNVATFQNIKVEADALKMRLLNEIDKISMPPGPEEPRPHTLPSGEKPETHPQPIHPKPPRVKNISIKNINTGGTWRIKDKNEIDTRLDELRQRLYKEMEDDTILNIEF